MTSTGAHGEQPAAEEVVPKWKRPRLELPADVPEDASSIALVQELIRQNNTEKRPRKRLTLFDIINDAFVAAARGGVSAHWASDDGAEALALRIVDEGRTQHKMLPRSSSLSRVLYDWHTRGRMRSAMQLLRRLVECQTTLPTFFVTSVDEKVVSVALRCVVSSQTLQGEAEMAAGNAATSRRDMVSLLLAAIPGDAVRRRVYAPLLAQCAETHDAAMMAHTLQAGLSAGMEFWDADFNTMLRCFPPDAALRDMADGGAAMQAERRRALLAVLQAMEAHHPVVGSDNAQRVAQLLGGREVVIPHTGAAAGRCPNCCESLSNFDFSESERQSFADDILHKLIRPRVLTTSHYEPETAVSDAVRAQREAELDAFLAAVRTLPYDAVIDGANVGYYGLSHWYPAAKRALLQARGVDVDRVSYGEVHDVPFPVDVSPQLTTVDDLVDMVQTLGYRPLVVLHQRHTCAARQTPANQTVLAKWRERGQLLASPSFLNDDYCWLLAAVTRPRCAVVTNDLMRDHHFSMLSQRTFLRWRQRMRMTYKAFAHADGRIQLSLRPAALFSTWVQISGTSHRWHVPFLKGRAILDQATNKIRSDTEADARDDLDKDGGDRCDAWICTEPFADGPI